MSEKSLAGLKVLMVIAPAEFRDEELFQPKEVLEGCGAAVAVASTRAGEAKGMLGATHTPDLTLADCKAGDYHAVIVVGGMGSPEHLWDNKVLHKLLSETAGDNKVVAAICLSGAVLAKAGVVSGRKATVWPDPKAIEVLKQSGAEYSKDHVVADGKVITADGPEAARQFGESIAKELAKVASGV